MGASSTAALTEPTGPAETEPTHAIAAYVASLSYPDLPTAAVANAKTAILDTIGVALAGSREQVSQLAVASAATRLTADGDASVFGRAGRTSAECAALVNGVAAHAMDYDDRHHASTHVLPAALAMGEKNGASGRDLLVAYIAGREVRMALNEEFDSRRYGGHGPGSRGWHATGTLGSLGAAAAAGKIGRLSDQQLATAFGVASSLLGGLMANFGTMTKPLHAGNAARNGVLAATLAQAGFTGEPTILSARNGLVDAMCQPGECDLDRAVAALRASFHIVDHGVQVKPYPSCSGSHPYIESILDLQARYGFTADDVAAIETTCSGGLTRLYPRNGLECKFSAAYTISVALLTGGFRAEHCTDEYLSRPEVKSLLERISYIGQPWGDKRTIRVTLKDGRLLDDPVLPWRNLTAQDDIDRKFFENAEPVVGAAAAIAIKQAVDNLEKVSVRELTALVRVPSNSS